ncbi:hypothetical protein PQ459_07000 [Chryseobacterium sp. KACC 21268]|nr:hypothetical protein PQ459_07000 [Chryseobacterium sp. KACC 21268]
MKTNNQIIFYLLILISILSCEKDRDENTESTETPQLYSYHFRNMNFPDGVLASGNGLITIDYDNKGRPIKRNNGLVRLPQASGFDFAFSSDVYDDLVYTNDDVAIKEKSYSYPQLLSTTRHFKFENKKIVRRVNVGSNNIPVDTINYFYTHNKLSKAIRNYKKPTSETLYHYNSKGNLDSIVTRDLVYNSANQSYGYSPYYPKMRTVEIFKDYDNSENPTKNLMIFDDVFNRSLSENNYRHYEKKSYNYFGQASTVAIRTWEFAYNDGKIDFSK